MRIELWHTNWIGKYERTNLINGVNNYITKNNDEKVCIGCSFALYNRSFCADDNKADC